MTPCTDGKASLRQGPPRRYGADREPWVEVVGVVGHVTHRSLEADARSAAVGLVGVLLLARTIESLLFGIQSHDVIALIVATSTLSAVALLAGYIPARRAARTDPMQSLRAE